MQNLIITVISIALLACASKLTLDMAEKIFTKSEARIESISAKGQMSNFDTILKGK